jgi:isoleucyl-tRNA synthetase
MNALDPETVCGQFGADVLRYWVASVNWEEDVPCSENLLRQFGEHYFKVRNTLRFLLGNLYDFDSTSSPELLDLDRWIVEQVDLLAGECLAAYEAFDFGKVMTSIHGFCVGELSSFYLDAIKDRMYCDGRDWPSRRSAQAACHQVLNTLVRLLAPILCHTSEEIYLRLNGERPSDRTVHEASLEPPSSSRLKEARDGALAQRFRTLRSVRDWVFAEFEAWKAGSTIKDSQDVIAAITLEESAAQALRAFGEDLPNYFKMSAIELRVGERRAEFAESPFQKCARSRVRRPDVEMVNDLPLSSRDRRVLAEGGWSV